MERAVKPGHPGALVLGSIFCVPFILYGMGILTVPLFIGALLLALFLLLLLINFEMGFLIIILMRSSLDYLKNFTDFNLAALVSVALIVLGVFYVLFRKVDIFQYEDSPVFLIFLGMTAVSVFYSPDLSESLSDWLRLLSVFSVYLLARILFEKASQVKSAFIAIFLSALLPVTVATIQLITGQGLVLDGDQARIVGTFLHPNAFASYLLILLVIGTSQWLERDHLVAPALLRPLVAAIFVIFILTFSRGGWLAFIVSMLFLGAIRYRRLLILLPILLLIVVVAVPSTLDRIHNIFDVGYTHGRSAWDWRQDTWREILPLFYQKPLLGHGLATVEIEFGILAHNDYLRLLAETGILGFLAYLLLMLNLMAVTWRDFRKTRSELARGLQIGLIAMTVGFLCREFADNTLRNTVVMIYFWLLVALVRNMSRLAARAPASEWTIPTEPETGPDPGDPRNGLPGGRFS
ncbi:MAG: O-antigen ligase family protein [Candidatus Omnitrophota bacterium]